MPLSIMRTPGVPILLILFLSFVSRTSSQCSGSQSLTFARWPGVYPAEATPVFVYTAGTNEQSLVRSCLARCYELAECAAVVVAYEPGNCHGIAGAKEGTLRSDNDVAYFTKMCLELTDECKRRWWAVETTPGYHLNADGSALKVILNTTLHECYNAMLISGAGGKPYRSSQWMGKGPAHSGVVLTSDKVTGNCVMNLEDKYTEPESYRVTNYNTFYIESQCRHDYKNKIDRCSYEEYSNQTLKHVEFSSSNLTKEECKTVCEQETRFVCRGFSWTERGRGQNQESRGICDLHSEDLVTTGSWLLRRIAGAVYYRRVICLNISIECENTDLVVTYRPRSEFRGVIYVPGKMDTCSARASGGPVRLSLPMKGDCDVNFAYAISKGPDGITINRTMAYVMVMIQNNPIIQTAGDRWVRVGCQPGAKAATQVMASVAVTDNSKPSLASDSSNIAGPAGVSAVYSTSAAPLTMYVVRPEGDSAGAVSLGEPLELRIETNDPTEIEVYHLVASSRLGDSSVLLLDSRGCPTGQVDFPQFSRLWLGGTQRLSARFKAFRFPNSQVVRFALMVRFCQNKCVEIDCNLQQIRNARQTNDTTSLYEWTDELDSQGGNSSIRATVREEIDRPLGSGVVGQTGTSECGTNNGRVPLELEMVVGSRDILSADTLVRADHQATVDASKLPDGAMVCIHELLLVSLALAWLAVQVVLLLGCCVLVTRYRNLAETHMQKDYHSFDNVGFDTGSTHRRVHWPDDMLRT